MTRFLALLLTGAMCSLQLGCSLGRPVIAPSPTTGDKLRAIDGALRGDGSWIHPGTPDAEIALRRARVPDWCADLRARLLGGMPSMYAEIDCNRPPDAGAVGPDRYPGDAPRLYAPVDRERTDLRRAHAAGILDDRELEELLATLDGQASRPAFRGASERATPESATAGEWLRHWLDAYANAERVAGAELPGDDPNAPWAKSTRPWRRPDFWVDPKAANSP